MSDTTMIQVAQFAAVLAPAFQSGLTASASALTIPGINVIAPAPRVQAWRGVYTTGAKIGPVVGLSTAAVLVFNAWLSRSSEKSYFYLGAAAASMAIIPHTLILMAPTNESLLRLAANADAKGDIKGADVAKLISKWQGLNYARSVWPLVGGVLALYATLL